MEAFLTGSQKYGTPTDLSDVDMVVLLSEEDAAILSTSRLWDDIIGYDSADISLKFGNLNLIVVTDLGLYQAWKEGTQTLVQQKPVTREMAKDVLSVLCAATPWAKNMARIQDGRKVGQKSPQVTFHTGASKDETIDTK